MITVFANLLSYSNCVHVGVKIQKWFSLLVRSLLTGHLLIRDYKHLLEQALINSKFFCVSCSYVPGIFVSCSCILYDCLQDTTENQQYSAQ